MGVVKWIYPHPKSLPHKEGGTFFALDGVCNVAAVARPLLIQPPSTPLEKIHRLESGWDNLWFYCRKWLFARGSREVDGDGHELMVARVGGGAATVWSRNLGIGGFGDRGIMILVGAIRWVAGLLISLPSTTRGIFTTEGTMDTKGGLQCEMRLKVPP